MKREIKFRGKRVDNGKWVYGFFAKEPTTTTCYVFMATANMQYTGDFDYHEVIPETVGQFIGLKDKNGKEIYEGDIVSMESAFYCCENENYYVEWGKWCYCLYKSNGDFFASADRIRFYKSEVIGNIHEHKHLLETSLA